MAGRLIKENIQVERAVGQGTAQAVAETAVMLAGGDREVALACVRARPCLTSCEVQTGGIAVQGTVEFAALYAAEDGQVRSRSAQGGFTAVIPVEAAGPKMRARVLATVTGASGSEQDGRLELRAELRLEGFVTESASCALARDVQTDGEMAVKTVSVEPVGMPLRAQTRQSVAENFPLDDEGYTRVVFDQAQPTVERVQAMEGAVEVTGSVAVESLLAGADAAAPVGWQTEVIPFALEIADDGFAEGMQVTVTARVRDLSTQVVFNVDGEEQEGNLNVEYVLELTAEGIASMATQVLADAYPLNEEPFRAVYAPFAYLDALDAPAQVQEAAMDLELPADAPVIQQLVGAFASPVALDIVPGDAARAEGLLRVALLYRAPGGEGLALSAQEVPFAVDFDRVPGGAQIFGAELGQVHAERLSPAQAQVRATVAMRAVRAGERSAWVLDDIAFEGEPAVLPAGAVLYYPEPQETLWDVARRYRTTEEALRARNPEEKAPLLVYRRLTSF